MIHYRDRWFCPDGAHCANADGCDRVMTPYEQEAAARWWGSDDYPVAWKGGNGCYVPKEPESDQ